MAGVDPRIEKLRMVRADYHTELEWHRFLLDAVCSTGGFRGRVGPSAVSFLGWAAEAYARVRRQGETGDYRLTYLDQFPRESADRFSKRIDVSHYVNYTGPILETLLSYISKEAMNYDGEPPELTAWRQSDVDGKGATWERLMVEQVRPRCATLGWCPVLLDMPTTTGEEISVARAREAGIDVQAIPLYPMNLLDWSCDDRGRVVAAKVRTDVVVREDLLGASYRDEHYSVWYPDRVLRFVVRVQEGSEDRVVSESEVAHSHGRVPIVSFRASKMCEDDMRGPSVIGDLARVNKRIFNLDSELDDHLRNACFAILGVPVANMQADLGEIIAGNGVAMKIPATGSRGLEYVAPPATVPEAIEKRREVLVREVYRCARVEHAKPSGVTTSGIARAYEFEQTNRRLADIASGFARAEQEALRLVAQMKGMSGAERVTVTPPSDFSVEDLTADLANVIASQSIGLGATADAEIRRRVARRMLPNLPASVAATIDAEIDEIRDQQAQNDAMAREVADAGEEPADDPSDESSDTEDDATT